MALPLRQQLINEVRLMLGGQMVDVELDPEHYELAATLAFDRYRQRAGNSMEEAYMFLRILYETNVYTLPRTSCRYGRCSDGELAKREVVAALIHSALLTPICTFYRQVPAAVTRLAC